MTTKEIVWREILRDRHHRHRWQQKELAARLGISAATVHAALAIPRRAGALKIGGRGFELADWRKLLLIWAVHRNLYADAVWQVHLRLEPDRVEGEMLPEAHFTGPSGFKFRYGYVPADYDQVLVYLASELLPALRRRLENALDRRRGRTLLTVLRPDPFLAPLPPEQIYVDLWQLHPWWAAEFIRAMEERWR